MARFISSGAVCFLAWLVTFSNGFAAPPESLVILGRSIPPGSHERLDLDYGAAFLGDAHTTPVLVMHGAASGPILCLTAAVHGDEINGVEVIRRLLKETDPARLSGTVIAVPAVNWLAFLQGSRETPERRDINRYFPGDPEEDYASRLTHTLFEKLLKPHCDYLIDLHTASLDRINLPQLRADLDDPAVQRFAARFGELPVLAEDGSRRMLRRAAGRAGMVAVAVEFGAANTLQAPAIDTVTQSLGGLMQRLGMREGQPAPAGAQEIYRNSVWLRVPEGGLFLSRVQPGDRVRAGDTVGILANVLGQKELVLRSPVTGRVLGLALDQLVLPGHGVAHIGTKEGSDRP